MSAGSRLTVIVKNESKQTDIVGQAFTITAQRHSMKSLTLDNGSEFVGHQAYPSKVFFCHPGSPWEKGSIEHLNGMLRRELDYRVPIEEVTQEMLDQISLKINNRPRKILGFLTPFECLAPE